MFIICRVIYQPKITIAYTGYSPFEENLGETGCSITPTLVLPTTGRVSDTPPSTLQSEQVSEAPVPPAAAPPTAGSIITLVPPTSGLVHRQLYKLSSHALGAWRESTGELFYAPKRDFKDQAGCGGGYRAGFRIGVKIGGVIE